MLKIKVIITAGKAKKGVKNKSILKDERRKPSQSKLEHSFVNKILQRLTKIHILYIAQQYFM